MEPLAALQHFHPRLEEELRAVLEQCERPLHTLMAHHLGWVDELDAPVRMAAPWRLRGTLCLVAARAAGGSEEQVLPAAAAVELVHNFSMIHEDIQNGIQDREHRPTVWWVWGPAQAINAGDGMHALARLALFRLVERGVAPERVLHALTLLDQSCLQLCVGQHLDLTYQEHLLVAEEQYLKLAGERAGALIGCAMELAALVSDTAPRVQQAFGQAGQRLGIALQLWEDQLALWPPGDASDLLASALLNKRKTLPVIYGLAQAKGNVKRELGAAYFKRVLEPQDLGRVAQLLEGLGAREYTQQVMERYYGEAMEALDGSGLSQESLRDLKGVARFLVERTAGA